MEYKKLQIEHYPELSTKPIRPESNYWNRFKTKQIINQPSPYLTTHITSSPMDPSCFALSSSTRLYLYDAAIDKTIKTFSRFQNTIFSSSFRSDGQLIAVGGASNDVYLLNPKTSATEGNILRTLKGHKNAIHSTTFAPLNKTNILSCSDDKTARYWDITTGTTVSILGQHTDYIRSATPSLDSQYIWATAGYDHIINLWDIRLCGSNNNNNNNNNNSSNESIDKWVSKSTMQFNHGSPVESCIILPGGGILLSAGSNIVKVWDLFTCKMLFSFSNHQKTITNIGLDGTNNRLYTTSLDGLMKIYDINSYQVIHSFKFGTGGEGIVSSSLSTNNNHIIVGTTGLKIYNKEKKNLKHHLDHLDDYDIESENKKILRGGTYLYFMRGKNYKPPIIYNNNNNEEITSSHLIVDDKIHKKKIKYKDYDIALKKFDYRLALDLTLKKQHPNIICSLLKELKFRGVLRITLKNHPENTFISLLECIHKYIMDPKYGEILIEIFDLICDLYSTKLGQNKPIDQWFHKIYYKLNEEIKFQPKINHLLGIMDTIIASKMVKEVELSSEMNKNNNNVKPTQLIINH